MNMHMNMARIGSDWNATQRKRNMQCFLLVRAGREHVVQRVLAQGARRARGADVRRVLQGAAAAIAVELRDRGAARVAAPALAGHGPQGPRQARPRLAAAHAPPRRVHRAHRGIVEIYICPTLLYCTHTRTLEHFTAKQHLNYNIAVIL